MCRKRVTGRTITYPNGGRAPPVLARLCATRARHAYNPELRELLAQCDHYVYVGLAIAIARGHAFGILDVNGSILGRRPCIFNAGPNVVKSAPAIGHEL